LELTEEGSTALDAWYFDFAPEHLQTAGIKYVMVSTYWLDTHHELAQQQLNDETLYHFLGEWSHPAVAPTYRLYEVIGAE
jgi:hypothetical protein